MTIGRNEPCPCGSGKKYKKCCIGRMDGKAGSESMQNIMDEIEKNLGSGEYSSLEEAQACLGSGLAY